MTRFSANLGFLWTELPLPDAIRAAAKAGFDAVECHWPYDCPTDQVKSALDETGLPMLGLNTRRGDVQAGENGLCALPGRETEAWASVEDALGYATTIGAGAVHAMAGKAEGKRARDTFIATLKRAADRAESMGITILIEPLNAFDAPGYFLQSLDQAAEIIAKVAAPNVRLMFDCYHVGRTEGNVLSQLDRHLPITGHVQFASVPDRGTPDHGEVDYHAVFDRLKALGWDQPLGAEYRPVGATNDSLGWLAELRET